MRDDELACLKALQNGAKLEEAFSFIKPATPEQLARLDERGDPIEWGMDEILRQIDADGVTSRS